MSIPNGGPERTSHYFDSSPSAASNRRLIQLDVPGRTLSLETDAGVFARGRLDPGTRVLLAEAPAPPAEGELLDLGSGYGPIALWLAASSPGARVWAVDSNQRALELTRRNAELAGLDNVVASKPAEVPPKLQFGAIYSNPPVRVGKQPLHGMLAEWLARLEEGAPARLVVQRHLGADSLARWLSAQGWQVRRLASKRAYRVLEVTRSRSPDASGV
jgi:16S rRNA (guanine1207-N2)-methyltransferase